MSVLLGSVLPQMHWLLDCRHQEAEERYKRRESRPEDLEEIQTLKATVVELQTRVKGMAVCVDVPMRMARHILLLTPSSAG